MKVLQLIDSLEAGGAERVAVNYANGLLDKVDGSYLCATRTEGLLKDNLKQEVGYLFLKKKSALDITAIRGLCFFIKKEGITLIHAHGSSFFLATLVKLIHPKIKLIWHDHYGNRVNSTFKHIFILKICSLFFSNILVVSTDLEKWAKKKLWTQNIKYIQNYPQLDSSKKQTVLKGEKNKRIVCLANLRSDKNHPFLIKAFRAILDVYPDWTLHLIGKDNNDQYAHSLKQLIKSLLLTDTVFLYGSCPDTSNILSQSQIGVLSSKSEGLPLALLEYGLVGLATITTDVGQCGTVITNHENGIVITSNNQEELCKALRFYIENKKIRQSYSDQLRKHILEEYSEISTLQYIVKIYNRL